MQYFVCIHTEYLFTFITPQLPFCFSCDRARRLESIESDCLSYLKDYPPTSWVFSTTDDASDGARLLP